MTKKSITKQEDKSMKSVESSIERKFYYPRQTGSFAIKAKTQEEADQKAAEIINKKLTPQANV